MEHIYVDFSKIKGSVKPMHSVNNGPAGDRVRGHSNFEEFKAACIPYVRNHDASACYNYGGEHIVDVHRIFKNFDADENDPASYIFAPTDAYITDIINAGSRVFYRLGATIEHGFKYGTYPPKDFEKWARVCEHIIRHYNEGWADGFRYGIEYWEIWNEPECVNPDGRSPCWQGTRDQFIEMFVTTVRHLKKCFPHLKIGGPAFCHERRDTWNKLLFDAIRSAGLTFDFFSFHGYNTDPNQYREQAKRARNTLDEFGFTDTEVILNEWNYVKGWLNENWKYTLGVEKSQKGASFIAASMICAQDSPMDHFMYYDARPCEMNGMFDSDFLTPLKGYYPFVMFSTLYEIGTETSAYSECPNIFVMSAMDERSGAVLITNYSDDDADSARDIRLSVSGLRDGPWKASYRLLDEKHDSELVHEEYISCSRAELYLNIPLFGVVLITLEKLN